MSGSDNYHLFTYDFSAEEAEKLGKANGNIYQLREGTADENSGVVMVRLKKKRYVVLDYTFVPTEEHIKLAELNPHSEIQTGAGFTSCTNSGCKRVGIPVLLYDSNPDETKSLYLRTGLCFECQRNLNEKRRTDRKRKGDSSQEPAGVLMFSVGPEGKRIKIQGKSRAINDDAIVLNGPLPDTKMCAMGFGTHEIGDDLYHSVHTALTETNRLVNSTPGSLTQEDVESVYSSAYEALYRSMYLITQWKVASETSDGPSSAEAEGGNMVTLLLAANKGSDENPFENRTPENSADV